MYAVGSDVCFFFELGYQQYSGVQRSLEYFRGSGIFHEEGSGVKLDTSGIPGRVAKTYDNYAMSCIIRADGNQQLADYLFDTNVFQYFYRVKTFNDLQKEREKQYKEVEQKAKK